MDNRLLTYLESSFLGELLKQDDVTDISYNGKFFFYMSNKFGRKKANIEVEDNKIMEFLRQIANLSENQFSYSEPNMDFSVGKYRINAVHNSIGRFKDKKVFTFVIRIGSEKNRIEDDKNFIDKKGLALIQNMIDNNESIIIAGSTGTGKTEFQKYLLSLLKANTRVIVIDNVQELECLREYEDLDLTSWQVKQDSYDRSFESLMRIALRSNPDWLIIAESRGKEMSDILLSVMSGHPLITTLHAYSLEEVPHRITSLVQQKNENQKYEDIYRDVTSHIKNYVYLSRRIDSKGQVVRYVRAIGTIDEKTREIKTLYERTKYEKD